MCEVPAVLLQLHFLGKKQQRKRCCWEEKLCLCVYLLAVRRHSAWDQFCDIFLLSCDFDMTTLTFPTDKNHHVIISCLFPLNAWMIVSVSWTVSLLFLCVFKSFKVEECESYDQISKCSDHVTHPDRFSIPHCDGAWRLRQWCYHNTL